MGDVLLKGRLHVIADDLAGWEIGLEPDWLRAFDQMLSRTIMQILAYTVIDSHSPWRA